MLFDGSEDITKTEQEIVYSVSVSSNGEFTSDFIGLIELGADRTAQAITDGLVRLLVSFIIPDGLHGVMKHC